MSEPTKPVRVIKRLDKEQSKRGNMPADPPDLLKTIEHMEAQAGRFLQMVRELKLALTTTK